MFAKVKPGLVDVRISTSILSLLAMLFKRVDLPLFCKPIK